MPNESADFSRFPMMRFGLMAALLALSPPLAPGGETVFEAGTGGYHSFRIPAVVRAKDGTLLAFCEGRKNNRNDHGDIDLVMKRSADHGLTWSGLRMIHDGGGSEPVTMGNPVPVVEKTSGRVHLVFCRNNSEVFHLFSDDHGSSWSPPSEITAGLKKEGWGWYATGPCHGIQLSVGEHRGRIVIPANHRIGKKGDDSGTYGSHVIFSDDSGKSWKLGAIAGEADGIHPNETTAVEMPMASQGLSQIVFNTRNNKGANPLGRASTLSMDGGETFTSSYRAIQGLDTPACQGSILRGKGAEIFFTSPRGRKRENLTLWRSPDGGATWNADRVISEGPSAYSDLVKTADGKLGVLYENGAKEPYDRISFSRLEVE